MIIEKNKPPPYRGLLDCALKIWRKEGIRGFYRGMLAPLSILSPVWALYFYGYSIGKDIFWDEHTLRNLDYYKMAQAGTIAGFSVAWLYAPIERLKCILQVQRARQFIPNMTFSGPITLAVYILKTWGITSLFRGYTATLARDLVGGCVYFPTYEMLRAKYPADASTHFGLLKTIMFGAATGVNFWIIVLPIDTLKSKIQTSPEGTYQKGMRSVLYEILSRDGPSGLLTLYRGMSATLIRAVPVNAAAFVGYEAAILLLNKIMPD
jgi:solute carrier family 25 carnitine/acylcarnitine transporter 20/29